MVQPERQTRRHTLYEANLSDVDGMPFTEFLQTMRHLAELASVDDLLDAHVEIDFEPHSFYREFRVVVDRPETDDEMNARIQREEANERERQRQMEESRILREAEHQAATAAAREVLKEDLRKKSERLKRALEQLE